MRLFVDTSAFLALEDRDDQNHESAMQLRESLQKGSTPFRMLFTTNYVYDETMTIVRSELGYLAAIALGESIKASKLIRVLWISPEIDLDAWKIFKKYKDKDFSYTDCTSFAIMEREGIDFAFVYDRHFEQYGIDSYPKNP